MKPSTHILPVPIKRGLAALFVVLSLLMSRQVANAVATVDLGTADKFAFLAGSGITVAGAVNTTTVTGSIGTFPTTSITGLANIVLLGVNNAGNAVTQTAKSDLLKAFNSAVGRPAGVSYGPGHDFGGQTLVAGVYNSSSTLALTGKVTLDGRGDPGSVFILQAGSSLTTASNSSVVLINGAQACNVFWVVGSSATLGTGTKFKGNILARTSITLNTSATVDGRVLAINGAVTLDTNKLMLPICSVVDVTNPNADSNSNTDTVRIRTIPGDSSGTVIVAPLSYTLVAQTPNQTNVARALDEWIGIETGDIGAVTLALDLLTAEQYPVAFEAIMPGLYASALSTNVELSQNQGQMLFQQLSARHLGRRRQPVESTVPERGRDAKNVVPMGGRGKTVIPVTEDSGPIEDVDRWTSWVQASGMFSSGGMSLNGSPDFESGTFLAGTDYAVTEHFALGLFGGYQESWSDFDGGSSVDSKGALFGAYAAVDYGGFYANGAVGGGTTDYSVTRTIQWQTLQRSTRSDPSGTQVFGMVGTGYDFHAGNFTFGPAASLQYTKHKLDRFTEHGAGVLDLEVDNVEAESLRSYLGARVAYTWRVSEDITLIPELRVFSQHEFMQDGSTINAKLDRGNGPGFSHDVAGTRDRDAVFGGVGVGMLWGKNFTTSIYYNTTLGRRDYDQQSITLVAGWQF